MIRQATGSLNGISLSKYKPGQAYELEPSLADFLILEGFAMAEMRRAHRRKTDRRKPANGRRGGADRRRTQH
jgi:hypothetical protein